MAKKLIFAVAGSGKTTKILDSIDPGKRSLIVTYTNENLRSLEASLFTKYGHVPSHVTLCSYFSFLYTFCFRPFFSYTLRDNAYTWKVPRHYPGAPGKASDRHYITKGRYLYSNRVGKFLIEKKAMDLIRRRLEKYFDDLFIDEVQDFAENDFNFMMELSRANVPMLFVGDFYQHTFDTSRDGNIRTNLHKNGVDSYLSEFEKHGFEVDTVSLSKTYRCSPTVCNFITENIGINIQSHRNDQTMVNIIEKENIARLLFGDDEKVKLFYQDQIKYPCHSNNWGKSKGLNKYHDVCVVLNSTSARLFRNRKLSSLPESTRNKLYVACSRTRGNLFLLDEAHLKQFKIAS